MTACKVWHVTETGHHVGRLLQLFFAACQASVLPNSESLSVARYQYRSNVNPHPQMLRYAGMLLSSIFNVPGFPACFRHRASWQSADNVCGSVWNGDAPESCTCSQLIQTSNYTKWHLNILNISSSTISVDFNRMTPTKTNKAEHQPPRSPAWVISV